jgi:hypothetical protein
MQGFASLEPAFGLQFPPFVDIEYCLNIKSGAEVLCLG